MEKVRRMSEGNSCKDDSGAILIANYEIVIWETTLVDSTTEIFCQERKLTSLNAANRREDISCKLTLDYYRGGNAHSQIAQ